MTWLNRYAPALVIGALASACAGCQALMHHLGPKAPHADGTWTGRLVFVTVEDSAGELHDAAALRMESGPRVLRGTYRGETRITEQNVPYLNFGGSAILDPARLRVAEGARVRVRGRKVDRGISVAVDPKPRSVVMRHVERIPGEPPDTPTVIQMRGKPRGGEGGRDQFRAK